MSYVKLALLFLLAAAFCVVRFYKCYGVYQDKYTEIILKAGNKLKE